MSAASWLNDKPPADVTQLDYDALLDHWMANRNSLIGAMAADEMMKRLWTTRKFTDRHKEPEA